MSKKAAVPDAWDDDWENVADQPAASTPPASAPKLTKAEKRAQHQQLQKELWDSAENPARNHWLEAQGVVPLKQEFKPTVTLLSRKPQIATKDTADDGEDSEEEARKKREADFEERQRKAKIEREEKQRRYAEARERIMGSSTPTTSGSRESSQGRRGRGGLGRGGGSQRNSRPASASQSPTRAMMSAPGVEGQIYDPNDTGRRMPMPPKPTSPNQNEPVRQPRAPPSDHTTFLGLDHPIAAPISTTPTSRPYPPPSPLQTRQQACNGRREYCSRSYSDVSLIGTHDSAFAGNIIDPRVNQEKSVTQQLNAGIRFLQAQTHTIDNGTVLEICHTTCVELDAGSLEDYLTDVKTWLDENADEVLTVLLMNGDFVYVNMLENVMESTGLGEYAFVPSTSPNMLAMQDWPTYGELIANGTRLVMFLDHDADEGKVPYILDEFTYLFETPYHTTDPSFPECTLDRPPNGSADGRMYIFNNFLDLDILGVDVPDNAADYTTNAASGNGSIGAQASLCQSMYARPPNVVPVDMFDRGNVFAAQDSLNRIS